MNETDILRRLGSSVADFDLEEARTAAEDAVRAGIPAYRAIVDGLAKGMEIVGEKYESNEYFLTELVLAAETFGEAMKVLQPQLVSEQADRIGKVVVATVKGDLHDIGKNILVTLLRSAGFDVYDLGVDVPPEEVVAKVAELGSNIVALSALLTMSMAEMRNVVERLQQVGLRQSVKVIVGGATLTQELAKDAGADAYGEDAVKGVEICERWMRG